MVVELLEALGDDVGLSIASISQRRTMTIVARTYLCGFLLFLVLFSLSLLRGIGLEYGQPRVGSQGSHLEGVSKGWSFYSGGCCPHTLPPDSEDRLRRCPCFSRTLRNFLGSMSELAAFILSIAFRAAS